jgi:phosphotransferase system HPr (HPr) family protein
MLALQELPAATQFAHVDPPFDTERRTMKIATRRVTVSHDQGLHLRPCMAIVNLVNKYRAKVMVRKGSDAVEAASMLGLLTLAAAHGTELVLSATGAESQEALDAVAGLFANGFQEC